jgi:hypothetical protein
VKETFKGQTVREGIVEVFELTGHATAHRFYAWAHETDDPDKPTDTSQCFISIQSNRLKTRYGPQSCKRRGTLAQKRAKIGRPKLPKGAAKGRIVPVRFTGSDLKAMAKAAKAGQQTVSGWIRRTIAMAINGSTYQKDSPAGSNPEVQQTELACSECGKPMTMTSLTPPAKPLCDECKCNSI